MVGMTW